ncbi:MAG: hypothetical protein N3D73_00700 [Candidatus Diapherotrites archaeon]|nr:hypothetical protein [Candidatus Diapherotrites archaeon]
MKLALYPNSPINNIENIEEIHLVRPINFKMLTKIIKNKKKISMSRSTYERLSKKVKKLLNENNIEINIETHQGRTLKEIEKIRDIVELRRDFRSYREIEKKIGIPKSTAHYLIRYAKRDKLKKGNRIFYL